ncbi:MAG: hypothetical protein AB1716_16935 [Planctomycetota bacterium]
MCKLDTILAEILALPEGGRDELLARLLANGLGAGEHNDEAAGQRGLAAWTEAVRGEDWSAFYPADLRNGENQRG